jgi:tRNA dimethylallyltransferase
MIENGLIEEARSLYKHKHLNALQTVGYKELFNSFDGKWDLDFAISEIKKNTRRFAKRQLTWFGKNKDIIWVDLTTPFDEILDKIMHLKNTI